MERWLVYGPGDLEGRPYRVDPFLRRYLHELYRVDPATGRRIRRRGLLSVAKGNSKTEADAAIGAFELAGPCVVGADGKATRRTSPDIPIAAASYDQADRVFGAARVMIGAGPLGDLFDIYDKEIVLKESETTRMYRVAAVAGTNDGLIPTCFIADELHEWVDRKARVHLVIGNGLDKREDTLEQNSTTAGANPDNNPAGALYTYGRRVAAGEVDDPSFVMHHYGLDPDDDGDIDLDDPAALRRMIAAANPASWRDHERVAQRWEVDRIKPHEMMRYYGNIWTQADTTFLPPGAWAALADPDRPVLPGADVVIAFDGSYNRDSSALYAWTVPEPGGRPHGLEVAVWERPAGPAGHEWVVPRGEVMARVADCFGRWRVVELTADRAKWFHEWEEWSERWGDVVTEFPQSPRRMAEASAKLYDAVVRGELSHDGAAATARHLANASTKESEAGLRIVKEAPSSTRVIDAGVAAVMGFDRALWRRDATPDPLANIW